MDENHKVIILKGLSGNVETVLSAPQKALEQYVGHIIFFWWLLWIFMFLLFISKYVTGLFKSRKTGVLDI